MNTISLLTVMIPSLLTFIIGIFISFPISNWLHKNKIWKKKNVTKSIDGKDLVYTAKIHNDENVKVPRMGGLIIWVSVLLTASIFYILDKFSSSYLLEKIDFTSRSQTWLPLFSLLFGGILGAIDDLSVVEYFKKSGSYVGGGLSLKARLFFVFLISLFVGYWFVYKLGMDHIMIPFYGELLLSPIYFFTVLIIMMLATYSGGIIDGVDGLSGGVMMMIYSAYGVIALIRDQNDIAALCFVIVSGILAFLWFNIPPAKFYNTETGMTGLLLTIVIIAYLVNGIAYLPVIGLLLYITACSSILQLLSKKFRGKKILLVAPIHHHFEALGMPNYKVAMRYWIVAYLCSITGVMLSFV